MTTSLKLFNGCQVVGPAGTGKTESVKELAKFMGIKCLIKII